MATGSPGDAGSAGTGPKPKVSPVRNVIGLVLLVAFAGTAIAEFMANRGQKAAAAALEKLGPKIDGGPTQETVEKEIGLGTTAKLKDEGGERSATYNWRGLVNTYKIKAYYTDVDPPKLTRIDAE